MNKPYGKKITYIGMKQDYIIIYRRGSFGISRSSYQYTPKRFARLIKAARSFPHTRVGADFIVERPSPTTIYCI